MNQTSSVFKYSEKRKKKLKPNTTQNIFLLHTHTRQFEEIFPFLFSPMMRCGIEHYMKNHYHATLLHIQATQVPLWNNVLTIAFKTCWGVVCLKFTPFEHFGVEEGLNEKHLVYVAFWYYIKMLSRQKPASTYTGDTLHKLLLFKSTYVNTPYLNNKWINLLSVSWSHFKITILFIPFALPSMPVFFCITVESLPWQLYFGSISGGSWVKVG